MYKLTFHSAYKKKVHPEQDALLFKIGYFSIVFVLTFDCNNFHSLILFDTYYINQRTILLLSELYLYKDNRKLIKNQEKIILLVEEGIFSTK